MVLMAGIEAMHSWYWEHFKLSLASCGGEREKSKSLMGFARSYRVCLCYGNVRVSALTGCEVQARPGLEILH